MEEAKFGRKSWRRQLLLSADAIVGWFLQFQLIHQILQRIFLVVAWLWAGYTFKLRNRLTVVGKENLPHSSRVLYLSNHQTLIDSFLVGLTVIDFWEAVLYPSRIPWNAPDAKNYLSRPLFRHVFSLLKNIPIKRKTLEREVINRQKENLRNALQQSSLLLFFEGTRSRTGEIGECVSGVGDVIANVQPEKVVPILLHDVSKVMPIRDDNLHQDFSWNNIKSGQKVWVVIGEPIDFQDVHQANGALPEKAKRQIIGQRVRDTVLKLRERLPLLPC